MFSNEQSLVLDPCAGSGTTGRSAVLTNRNYLLFDLNPNGKQIFEESIKDLKFENLEKEEVFNPLLAAF